MIRSTLISTLMLVGCVLAQSTWFHAIAFLGVIPDLSLIVLIWLAYKNGPAEGAISGFLAGIAQDFLSAAPLGFHAFVKTAVAAVVSLLHGSFFIDRLFLPFALGVAGTIVKAVSIALLYLLFGDKVHGYTFFDRVLWIEAMYNGVLAPLVFFILSLLKRVLVMERDRE